MSVPLKKIPTSGIVMDLIHGGAGGGGGRIINGVSHFQGLENLCSLFLVLESP